jgi:hypothetical protein
MASSFSSRRRACRRWRSDTGQALLGALIVLVLVVVMLAATLGTVSSEQNAGAPPSSSDQPSRVVDGDDVNAP